MNGRAWKLKAYRHGDETGAHGAVIGREIFGAIGGEDGNAIAARKTSRHERPGDPVGHGVELAIAHLARDPAAEIDDRDLAEIPIAPNESAEVDEVGHWIFLGHLSVARNMMSARPRKRGGPDQNSEQAALDSRLRENERPKIGARDST